MSEQVPAPASQALRRHGLRPRKRLGQNFLRDRRFLKEIVQAADLSDLDSVLELGAGTGVLTRALAAAAGEVVAVELDDALFELLRKDFSSIANVKIWHGNALEVDPCEHLALPYKLVGNIPYYITGPIVRRYLEMACRPEVLVLMVQREVAERMVAPPGDLSLLGVSVQFYADASIVTRVPAGAFYPRPKVDSAIIRLIPHQDPPYGAVQRAFFEVARAGFSARRKQLGNALANGLKAGREDVGSLLTQSGIAASRRAETLSLEEWNRLARAWLTTSGERAD